MTVFRRHAVEFEAVQFNGENFDEIRALVGTRPTDDWDIDANRPHVIENFNPIGTYLIPSESNRDAEGELWDANANKWRPVWMNEWIVQQDEGWLTVTTEWLAINCVKLDEETLAILRQQEEPKTFGQELVELLNKHSMENYSGTPDWVLGNFLEMVLRQFDCAVKMRADWRGESVELPALNGIREGQEKEVPKSDSATVELNEPKDDPKDEPPASVSHGTFDRYQQRGLSK